MHIPAVIQSTGVRGNLVSYTGLHVGIRVSVPNGQPVYRDRQYILAFLRKKDFRMLITLTQVFVMFELSKYEEISCLQYFYNIAMKYKNINVWCLI